MEKEKFTKEIITQVIIALIIQIVLYGIGYFFSSLAKEKLNITVCASTKTDSGYVTSINIKNYQDDKSIGSVVIWSDTGIDFNRINYADIENQGDKVILKNIPPLFDETIFLYSSNKIDDKNISFETEEKRIVKFLSQQEPEITNYWKTTIKSLIPSLITYAIAMFFISIITQKKLEIYNLELEQLKSNCQTARDESQKIEKNFEKSEKKIKELQEGTLKNDILFHRRIADYAKELDCYRFLLKKIINNEDGEDVCYKITKTLKTFRTLDKIDFKDLEFNSLKLSKLEEKYIKDGLKKDE